MFVLGFGDQVAQGDLQTVRHPLRHIQAKAHFPKLDRAHVCPMDSSEVRKRLLREASGFSPSPEDFSKRFADGG
jgi:hypothetical protein